jgi:hemerythrin superfamily protein
MSTKRAKKSTKSKAATARRSSSSSSRGKQRTRSRSAAARRPQDAIALLKADHREVDELMERFEKARGDRKEGIARQICLALTVHAQIEEELLYPRAREALGDEASDLVDEADVEHTTIKRLVVEVESSSPADALYEAKVKVIGEYVKHHVREEEKELFPMLRGSGIDLKALGEQLAERKAMLMQEWQQAA